MRIHPSARNAVHSVFVPLAGLLLLAARPSAHAVTAITVDDHPDPITLTTGETALFRFHVAKDGGSALFTPSRDLTRSGRYDPQSPVPFSVTVTDNGSGDTDATPGKVAHPRPIGPGWPSGGYIIHVQNTSDNSVVTLPGVTVTPKPEGQAISGHVPVLSDANPTGVVPPDAIVWATSDGRTLLASANIRPDGSYTLPLPPGSYVLFAEWFGRLKSQRQRVDLAAGQQQGSVDLPLLRGEEVSGTVRNAGEPIADAPVRASSPDGRSVATRTLADGSYVMVLPSGRYTITAPGGTEDVVVADGAVDGVDFPAAAPGAAPVPGTILTVAGNGLGDFGGDGRPAVTARLPNPQGLAFDPAGNLYVSDSAINRVRRMDARTGIITTIAGSIFPEGIRHLLPPVGSGGLAGDGGPATAALLNAPQWITTDAGGNLYIADLRNHRVRKVDVSGVITTVAGSGEIGAGRGSFSGDGAQPPRPPSTARRCWRSTGEVTST
jgi:hypothetical protein